MKLLQLLLEMYKRRPSKRPEWAKDRCWCKLPLQTVPGDPSILACAKGHTKKINPAPSTEPLPNSGIDHRGDL